MTRKKQQNIFSKAPPLKAIEGAENTKDKVNIRGKVDSKGKIDFEGRIYAKSMIDAEGEINTEDKISPGSKINSTGGKINSKSKINPEDKINAEDKVNPKRKISSKTPSHYTGHRDRLRERFKETQGKGFSEYELLELLLFRSVARADTKPLAKALLAHFGSLANVLNAESALLQKVKGCGPAIASDLKIIKHIHEHVSRTEFEERDIFNSWEKVLFYCKTSLAHETKEQFRVMFLDKKNGLIKDEIQQIGTVDQTPVYPREILKRALELAASSLILIHNHPSGDPTPSKEDIIMTKKVQEAAKTFNITVHDHIIIGRYGYVSMKNLELL